MKILFKSIPTSHVIQTVVFLLNQIFVSLNVAFQVAFPTKQTYQKKKKMYNEILVFFSVVEKILVSGGFWSISYKSMGIYEYAGVLKNYNIFELKQYRI